MLIWLLLSAPALLLLAAFFFIQYWRACDALPYVKDHTENMEALRRAVEFPARWH